MIFLEAEIGQYVTVTFIKASDGFQTLQRINGRRAFLDRTSKKIRAGDRCRVQVTGENPNQSVYFVKVHSLLEAGDGGLSAVEKVLKPLTADSNSDRFWTSNPTFEVLANARALSDGVLLTHANLLVDVLEFYTLERRSFNFELHNETFAENLCAVVASANPKDSSQAASLYLRAGKSYFHINQLQADKFFCKALDFVEEKDIKLREKILSARSDLGINYRNADLSLELTKHKLNNRSAEAALNWDELTTTAFRLLEEKRVAETLALLEPLVSPTVFENPPSLLPKLMCKAYILAKRYIKAETWLDKIVSHDDDYEVIAWRGKILLEQCEFEQAAMMLNSAFDLALDELNRPEY